MRVVKKFVVFLLVTAFLVPSTTFAQQARVVDEAAMRQALAAKVQGESDQRDAVRRVLNRDDVRDMAARMGLDAGQAASAVATLSGSELETLAHQAAAVESATLAGGDRIVISTVTALLIVIIIILLAK